MTHRAQALVLLPLLGLLVSACGAGDASSDAGTAGPLSTPAATATLTAEATPTGTPTASAAPASPATPAPSMQATPSPAVPKLSPDNIVPSVQVVDVRTGAKVDVLSVVPADKPVLLWAWAPHCPACRAEAPSAEAFAKQHSDEVTMVGLGTQDDLAYAEGFLRDTGVKTPQMLWDASFESWAQLGISAQPTWILVDGGGAPVQAWVGPLPESDVLAAVRGVSG